MAADWLDFKFTYEDLRKVSSSRKPISKWYTATEVGTHCSVTDCWVTISGRVYDVTPLFVDNPPLLCEPIIMNAGKDISHWFEPRTFDVDEKEIDVEVLLWFHPVMHINTYFTPQGRFAHIPPPLPRSDFNMDYDPWWLDKKFVIGYLSQRTQFIRVKNILLDHVYTMEVPSEETINEILYRYTEHNNHAASYEWKAVLEYEKCKFITLDMEKTLTENGVKDESQDFGAAGMELDYLLPAIMITPMTSPLLNYLHQDPTHLPAVQKLQSAGFFFILTLY